MCACGSLLLPETRQVGSKGKVQMVMVNHAIPVGLDSEALLSNYKLLILEIRWASLSTGLNPRLEMGGLRQILRKGGIVSRPKRVQ